MISDKIMLVVLFVIVESTLLWMSANSHRGSDWQVTSVSGGVARVNNDTGSVQLYVNGTWQPYNGIGAVTLTPK